MHPWGLRELAKVTTKLLSIVYERSWRTREMSEDWRIVNATQPLKSRKEDLWNYRTTQSHLWPWEGEGTSYSGCYLQTSEKNVIRISQHGFTEGKSYLTNLVAFYDGITGWVDEGRAVDVVYLGFSKASDTVSHNIFMGMLWMVGYMSGLWGGLRTDWLAELRGWSLAVQGLLGGL